MSGGGRTIDGADVATPVTGDVDVGGGCGLGRSDIVDAIEDGGATSRVRRGDDAGDVLGCDGTEEGGTAVAAMGAGRGDDAGNVLGCGGTEEGGAAVAVIGAGRWDDTGDVLG